MAQISKFMTERKRDANNTSKVEKNRGQFQKGKPKTGGREKGTPNKKKQELIDRIEEKYPNYDPLLSLVAIGNDPETPLELKVTCHKEVAKYIHPQRKAVDISGDMNINDEPIEVKVI